MKRKIPPGAIQKDLQRRKDDDLQEEIWRTSSGRCPFKTNRGFDFDDEHCETCQESEGCFAQTGNRLLGILYGLATGVRNIDFDFEEYLEPYEEGEYLDAVWDKERIQEKRDEIRHIANEIIEKIDPEKTVHPNTRTYFGNCFPEWVEYENWLEEDHLKDAMQSFYVNEWEKLQSWPPPGYDAEDLEDWAIGNNDWRGYPFDDLFEQHEAIPRKIIKQFTQDYFRWQRQIVKTEEQIARRLGLFGKAQDKEKWPRGWMMADKKIKEFMESNKGKFFIELVKYLENNRMKKVQGEAIAKKLGYENQKYVLVQLDRNKAAEYLAQKDELNGISVSPEKVYRFIRWMCDYEMINKLGQPGERENLVYAIGKWGSFPDQVTGTMRPNVYPFIKEKNKAKLRKAMEARF